MKNPRLWILLVLLTILGAILLPQLAKREPPPEKSEARLETRCGEALAKLVAKQLPKAKDIVLVAHTPGGDGDGITEAFLKQATKRGLNVGQTVHLASQQRMAGDMQIQRLDANTLQRAIKDSEEVDAIVSLCGEPTGRLDSLGSIPPMFCLCDELGRIPELMKKGIVHGAYVPRQSPPATDSKDDWFDLLYELALPN